MAKVIIVIEDQENYGVGVGFKWVEPQPESALLYTNAQNLAKEIEQAIFRLTNTPASTII